MSVSIVIPAYNAESFLKECIESAFAQSTPVADIVVVDDGSSDRTAEIAATFGSRIKFASIANSGVSHARNLGASLTSGEWLLFLDADDLLLPSGIADLHASVGDAGVAYGMVIQRREPPLEPVLNGFASGSGTPPVPAKNNFRRSQIQTPGSALVKRSLFDQVGGFVTGFEPMEDRDFWIKCGLLEPITFCNKVVLDKRWQPSSHGSQHSKRIYRGMLSKMALRQWSLRQQVDFFWAGSDESFVSDAIKEALYWQAHDILPSLVQRGLSLPGARFWASRAWLRVQRLRLSGHLPPPPVWLPSEF